MPEWEAPGWERCAGRRGTRSVAFLQSALSSALSYLFSVFETWWKLVETPVAHRNNQFRFVICDDRHRQTEPP